MVWVVPPRTLYVFEKDLKPPPIAVSLLTRWADALVFNLRLVFIFS